MAARPLSDETLHLIGALRTALAQRSDVDERTMFGCYCFFVDGKLCMGVKGEELLVRLPPDRHGEFQEMQNTRELSPNGGACKATSGWSPTATPRGRSGAFGWTKPWPTTHGPRHRRAASPR